MNGRCIEINSGSGLARVNDGTNVVAAHVINPCWSGGLGFTLTLPDGRSLVSDASWKCNTHSENDWFNATFNDSGWPQAQALCPIDEKYVGYDPKRSDLLARFHETGAQFLGPASPQYYRTTFESRGGDASLLLRGIGFTNQIWLNGKLLAQGNLTKRALTVNGKHPGYGAENIACQTKNGRNVLAIQIASMQPDGGGCLWKCGLFHTQPDGSLGRISSGIGWRNSSVAAVNWMKTGFDDGEWSLTTAKDFINDAYDAGSDISGDGTFSAFWLSPGDIYFRKSFTVVLDK